MKTVTIPLCALLFMSCGESLVLRSAGQPCTSASECESNLCYESVCLEGPDGPMPADQAPTEMDCAALCEHLVTCGVSEEGETVEGCAAWCDENQQLIPPLMPGCAETHLSGGQCDEAAFGECADGPVIEFFERASTAFCTRAVACCEGQDAGLFSSVDECVGLAAGLGGGFINAAELLGYVSFDVAVAEACAVKVEEVVSGTACEVLPADMGAYLGDMAACAGLITPLQGEGDPCGLRFEGAYTTLPDGCIEGLVCEGEGDVMPTCEQGIAPGGDCSAEGAQCGGAVCVDGVCTVQGAVDAPCTSGSECASGNCIGGACGLPDPICPPSVVDAGEAG